MEYKRLVHLWPFKKKIGSLDIRFNDFPAFQIFSPKSRETRISVVDARAFFHWTQDFQEVIKSAPVSLET